MILSCLHHCEVYSKFTLFANETVRKSSSLDLKQSYFFTLHKVKFSLTKYIWSSPPHHHHLIRHIGGEELSVKLPYMLATGRLANIHRYTMTLFSFYFNKIQSYFFTFKGTVS